MAAPGTLGFYTRYLNDPAKEPGMGGFYATYRRIGNVPGVLGFSAGRAFNSTLNVYPTNAASLPTSTPPTISISWPGQNPEVYIYTTDFANERLFPVGVTVTVAVSGAGYVPTSVAFTPTEVRQIIAIPITQAQPLNAYRRLR